MKMRSILDTGVGVLLFLWGVFRVERIAGFVAVWIAIFMIQYGYRNFTVVLEKTDVASLRSNRWVAPSEYKRRPRVHGVEQTPTLKKRACIPKPPQQLKASNSGPPSPKSITEWSVQESILDTTAESIPETIAAIWSGARHSHSVWTQCNSECDINRL